MDKIWKWISAILGGIIIGLIIGAKWIGGDDYKAYIRRLKQKGGIGNKVDFVPFLGTSPSDKGLTRLERKKVRKAVRETKRDLRKNKTK